MGHKENFIIYKNISTNEKDRNFLFFKFYYGIRITLKFKLILRIILKPIMYVGME